MKKLLLPVIGLLLTVTLSAQTSLGGRYFNLIWAEDGNTLFSENNLTLIPHDGTYDFSISVKMHDGTHAWVGTDEVGTLKVENGNLWYIHPNKNYDFELEIILHPVDEDGQPIEDSIQIIEHKGDTGSPYPDEVCFEGIYSRVYPVFTDDKGYLYQMKGEDICELINGGLYEGTVTVPRTVYYPLLDAQAEVVGIAEDAFSGCYDLEAVSFENPDIYIGPSAFMGSGIPYDYESILKPKFAYPNQDFSIFVVPTEESVAPEQEQNMWMVFKQNIQPVWQSGNTASDEEKDLGRADFDFENNRLYLCENRVYTPKSGAFSTTLKTGENRYVSISPTVVNLLKCWKEEQSAFFAHLDIVPSGYVMTADNGQPMHPDSPTDWLAKFAKRHGLPPIHPHKFRHTQATLLISEGVDILTVSKRLGHAKVSTTLDIYSHVLAKSDQQASNKLDSLIFKISDENA